MKYSIKKLKLTDIITIISLLLIIITTINLPKISSFVSSIYSYIYIIFALLLFANNIRSNKFISNKKEIAMLFCIILFASSCYVINGLPLGNYMTVVGTILYVYSYSKDTIHDGISKVIFFLVFVILITMVLNSSASVNHLNDNTMSNPNYVAQMILVLSIYMNYFIIKFHVSKLVLYIVNIISIVGIYMCNCRNVLFSIILYLIIMLLFKYIIKKDKIQKKIVKTLLIIIPIVGVAIPYLFVYLYKNHATISISLFGKNFFSGREKIWVVLFEYIFNIKSLAIGTVRSSYINYLPNLNLHNIYLLMITNYGMILSLMYFKYIFSKMPAFSNKYNKYIVTIGLLVIMICGIFEQILFNESLNYLICLLYALTNDNQVTDELRE